VAYSAGSAAVSFWTAELLLRGDFLVDPLPGRLAQAGVAPQSLQALLGRELKEDLCQLDVV
jgi:hypothetical protein